MAAIASLFRRRWARGNPARIVYFLVERAALALVTLALLSALVFALGQLLPGDVGRAILGPLADPRAVAALDHQLGADKPVLLQYAHWISRFIHGDMGTSYAFREPVAPFVAHALANSAKLAALAFVIVVPLGIASGVWAALHEGRWPDRTLMIVGMSATVVPEFVSSIVLILVFGVWLRWLPTEAVYSANVGVFTALRHLILPTLPLVFVLFGYIARMARSGTVEALDADYTRTAVLKGLPPHVVVLRHVLRNALPPTITVAATQLGYMVGGLVVVETLFHYQGIGLLIYNAATAKDFPMLEAGVLCVGIVYTFANLLADALLASLDPRRNRAGAQ
jgi:peptide/nickel transport system permease protein